MPRGSQCAVPGCAQVETFPAYEIDGVKLRIAKGVHFEGSFGVCTPWNCGRAFGR